MEERRSSENQGKSRLAIGRMQTFYAYPHGEFMNNRRSLFLSIEAMALGGPSSLLFIFGLPYIVGGSIYELVQGRLTGPIGALSSAWALLQFWSLAFCTISQRPFRFGVGFGLGVLASFIGIAVMHVGMPYWLSAVLIGLPLLGAIHFSYEQILIRRTFGQIL